MFPRLNISTSDHVWFILLAVTALRRFTKCSKTWLHVNKLFAVLVPAPGFLGVAVIALDEVPEANSRPFLPSEVDFVLLSGSKSCSLLEDDAFSC